MKKKKEVEIVGCDPELKQAIRFAYDEDGNPIRCAEVPFKEIPEEYEVKTIKLTTIKDDLSYLAYVRELSDCDIFKLLYKNKEGFIATMILSELSMDYLQSAIRLQKCIVEERNSPNPVISRFQIPFLFCCRHAIELKLKQCAYTINKEKPSGHSIKGLWKAITKDKSGTGLDRLNPFIQEVDAMDENGIVMRYGLNKNLELVKENYLIDVDALIRNTKYLFNVMEVECSFF